MESEVMAAKSLDLCSILYADQVTDGGVEALLPPETALTSGRWMERGRVYWRGQQAVAVLVQPYSLTTEDLAELPGGHLDEERVEPGRDPRGVGLASGSQPVHPAPSASWSVKSEMDRAQRRSLQGRTGKIRRFHDEF